MATRSSESRRGKKASASSQINASTSELEPPLDHPTTAMPAGTNSLVPFADDPIRCSRLAIPRQHIDALDGREFLNTALIDYLLQRSIQADVIAPYTIVGTSNSLRYFQFMNEKMMSRKPDDVQSAQNLRKKCQPYGMREFRFIAANCSDAHFCVISLNFDMTKKDHPFHDVCVYDSIRKSARKTDASIYKSTAARTTST